MPFQSVGSPAAWAGFLLLILTLLAFDLGFFRREAKEMTMRGAAAWTAIWVSCAALFNGFIWWHYGSHKAMEFAAGYLLEEALSVDNVFVFTVIFAHFGVPKRLQPSVLFWGILGALITRGAFILMGTALIHEFRFVVYLFGAFLIYTGFRLFFADEDGEADPSDSRMVRFARRILPVHDDYHGEAFHTRVNGRFMLTPLFVVLVAVEMTDVMFAVDSIPAVFGVTKDPFIVYTSNIFAILGLRSLFFLVDAVIDKFYYLKVGLSGLLAFIGGKLIVSEMFPDLVPAWMSLVVVAVFLGGSILASAVRSWMLGVPLGEDEKVSDDPAG
jgi:tellurite resistance protein TerC